MFMDENNLETNINFDLDNAFLEENSSTGGLNFELQNSYICILYSILIYGLPGNIKSIMKNKKLLSILASSKINTIGKSDTKELKTHVLETLDSIFKNSKIDLSKAMLNKLAESLSIFIKIYFASKCAAAIIDSQNLNNSDSLIQIVTNDCCKIKEIQDIDIKVLKENLENLNDKEFEIIAQAISTFENTVTENDYQNTKLFPSFLNKNMLIELMNNQNLVTSNQVLGDVNLKERITVKYTRNYNSGGNAGMYSPIFR